MALVIGKRCKHATSDSALSYLLGVTCGNDVSARNWQKNDLQWWRAKSSDTFAPIGPCIVTGLNPDNLQLKCRINGKEVQNQNTSDLLHNVSRIIEFVSSAVTLEAGDVIMTGTPGTPGDIHPGDTVEVTSIVGIPVAKTKGKQLPEFKHKDPIELFAQTGKEICTRGECQQVNCSSKDRPKDTVEHELGTETRIILNGEAPNLTWLAKTSTVFFVNTVPQCKKGESTRAEFEPGRLELMKLYGEYWRQFCMCFPQLCKRGKPTPRTERTPTTDAARTMVVGGGKEIDKCAKRPLPEWHGEPNTNDVQEQARRIAEWCLDCNDDIGARMQCANMSKDESGLISWQREVYGRELRQFVRTHEPAPRR